MIPKEKPEQIIRLRRAIKHSWYPDKILKQTLLLNLLEMEVSLSQAPTHQTHPTHVMNCMKKERLCSICKCSGHDKRTCSSENGIAYYIIGGDNTVLSPPMITSKPQKGNKGERGEIKIIEYLFDNMNNVEIIYKIFSINSKIKLIDPSNNKMIYDKGSINKSSGYFKADIIIDFIDASIKYNVSIKCNDGAPPTLLNHTPLCAKCWETGRLKQYTPTLTNIINYLNDKRKKGIYKEDIRYTDMELDENQINTIINIISYFTFEGTGGSESKCPADAVLVVGNSHDVLETSKFKGSKTQEMKLDYIKGILPVLRFSLRSGKGMPTKKEEIDKCKPWIYEHIDKKGDIKLCGALHIRFI